MRDLFIRESLELAQNEHLSIVDRESRDRGTQLLRLGQGGVDLGRILTALACALPRCLRQCLGRITLRDRLPIRAEPAMCGIAHDLQQPRTGITAPIAVEESERAQECLLYDVLGIRR